MRIRGVWSKYQKEARGNELSQWRQMAKELTELETQCAWLNKERRKISEAWRKRARTRKAREAKAEIAKVIKAKPIKPQRPIYKEG